MTAAVYTGASITGILETVRDAVTAALAQRGGDHIARAVIMPGAIAWDNCESYCGLLAVSLTRIYLTDDFPIEIGTTGFDPGRMHGTVLTAEMTIQAVRCAPAPAVGATAPPVAALEASSAQVVDDAWMVFCTLGNTLADLEASGAILHYLVRQTQTVGPEGGCVGSETPFSVGVSL